MFLPGSQRYCSTVFLKEAKRTHMDGGQRSTRHAAKASCDARWFRQEPKEYQSAATQIYQGFMQKVFWSEVTRKKSDPFLASQLDTLQEGNTTPVGVSPLDFMPKEEDAAGTSAHTLLGTLRHMNRGDSNSPIEF